MKRCNGSFAPLIASIAAVVLAPGAGALQTNAFDVLLLGHGSYQGAKKMTTLPAGVELWVLQPVGTIMTDGPIHALIRMKPIDRLILYSGVKTSIPEITDLGGAGFPKVYNPGDTVPDMILHDLDKLKSSIGRVVKEAGKHQALPHIITVDNDTSLSSLLGSKDVKKWLTGRKQTGKNLRVFWAACTASPEQPEDVDEPLVFHNAKAVSLDATAYMRKQNNNKMISQKMKDDLEDGADAVLVHARNHPDDTDGALNAGADTYDRLRQQARAYQLISPVDFRDIFVVMPGAAGRTSPKPSMSSQSPSGCDGGDYAGSEATLGFDSCPRRINHLFHSRLL